MVDHTSIEEKVLGSNTKWGLLKLTDYSAEPKCCPECNSTQISKMGGKTENKYLDSDKDGNVFWVNVKRQRHRCNNPDCKLKSFTPEIDEFPPHKSFSKNFEDMFCKELARNFRTPQKEIANNYDINNDVASRIVGDRLSNLKKVTTVLGCSHLYFLPFDYTNKQCFAVLGEFVPLDDSLFLLDIYDEYDVRSLRAFAQRNNEADTDQIKSAFCRLIPDFINELNIIYRDSEATGVSRRMLKYDIEKLIGVRGQKLYTARRDALNDLLIILNRILHTDEKYIDAIKQWSADYLYIVEDDEIVDREELTLIDKNALDITPQLYDFYELVLTEGKYIRHIVDYENKNYDSYKLSEKSIKQFVKIIEELQKTNFSVQLLSYRLLYACTDLEHYDKQVVHWITNFSAKIDTTHRAYAPLVSIETLYKEIVPQKKKSK